MKLIECSLLFALIAILSLTSCVFELDDGGGINDYDQWEYDIKQIILEIYQGYNNRNIFAIMEHFSQDFLHNNINYNEEEALWYDRFNQDNTAAVYNIHVNFLSSEFAKVSYLLKMDENYYNVNSISEYYSDVTIMIKENGFWKVYGNQNQNWEYYDVNVESYPQGARIYIDGNFTGKTTPQTIEEISPGQYTLGIYLRGYNEITETIYVDEHIYKDYDLQTPSYPTPDITILSPDNGETIYDNTFLLNGYIYDFEGDEAVITYNGVEYIIEVDEFGNFTEYLYIQQEENTFFLRATNLQGNTGTTEDYIIYSGD